LSAPDLLRGDAVTIERGLLLQGGDDVLAVDCVFGAGVVEEGFAFQLGFFAFTDKSETEELQRLTVNVQARTRRAQRQGHAAAVLADGEDFDFFLGGLALPPPLGLLIA
jgi:hypothetical protein